MVMDIHSALLVWVPSRRGKGAAKSFPVGLLYVGRILEDLGMNVSVFDVYEHAFGPENEDEFSYEKIKEVITAKKPQIVGFGGIASSYGWTKALSNRIKEDFPAIFQIAGGALSSAYQLLLPNTSINAVFNGEAEINLPKFIERLRNGKEFFDVPGISYLSAEGLIRNPPEEQVKNLDEIPFPAYHLVDIQKYIPENGSFSKKFLRSYRDDLEFQGIYEEIRRKLEGINALFPIVTSRGCTNVCSFCYRHMRKYRKHSVDYVIRHIKYVNDEFRVFGISFYDELFNGNMEWVFDLCDAIEANNLKIAYKTSARADRVSKEMLMRMSETGCFNLAFGQESGSDKILKEYRKGVTTKKNIETTLLPRECGIYSTVQLVIGSPGETIETINQTIDFLKKVKVKECSLNYLLPFPGAPIWEYVEQNNLIANVEDYLDHVSRKGGGPLVNLTKRPDKEWKNWADFIRYHLDRHIAVRKGDFRAFIAAIFKYNLKRILPSSVIAHLGKIRAKKRKVIEEPVDE
jgi:radical SAM superfamily enzyme YgiQ (UPF0313 family)